MALTSKPAPTPEKSSKQVEKSFKSPEKKILTADMKKRNMIRVDAKKTIAKLRAKSQNSSAQEKAEINKAIKNIKAAYRRSVQAENGPRFKAKGASYLLTSAILKNKIISPRMKAAKESVESKTISYQKAQTNWLADTGRYEHVKGIHNTVIGEIKNFGKTMIKESVHTATDLPIGLMTILKRAINGEHGTSIQSQLKNLTEKVAKDIVHTEGDITGIRPIRPIQQGLNHLGWLITKRSDNAKLLTSLKNKVAADKQILDKTKATLNKANKKVWELEASEHIISHPNT